MTDKLVSVVVPTYKGSDVISRAVNSVLEQTYPNIEIIVVDDNAPDSPERRATEVVMQQYDGIKNVIYLKHKDNKNGSAARNTGINYSHGEYVAFLDDDDWFLPEKIASQIDYLHQHLEYTACYCLAQREGEPIETTPYKGDVSKELLMLKSCMFTTCLFFRKETLIAINGFDESFLRHQDYELLLRFFMAGYKMGCVEEVLVELGTGAANNYPNGETLLELKNKFLKSFDYPIDLLDRVEPGFKKKIFGLHYGIVFAQFVKEHQFGKAKKLASKYFFYSPKDFLFPMYHMALGYTTRKAKRLFRGK